MPTTFPAAATTLLALFLVTHGVTKTPSPSPTIFYDFKPNYLPNLYLTKATERLPPAYCPASTVVHHMVARCTAPSMRELYVIPHSAITHDGRRCGTGKKTDYIILAPGRMVSSGQIASIHGLTPLYKAISANSRAKNAFKVLRGLDPVYVGVEFNGPRICAGETIYPKNTVIFFVIPKPQSQHLNFGFAYLHVLEVGMLTVLPDKNICLLKESRRLGPGQVRFSTPTPSPSPGIDYTITDDMLEMKDASDLPKCFPVSDVKWRARPSPPPIPSRTPMPSESSSLPPTPSTSPSFGYIAPSPSTSASASLSPSLSVSPSVSPSVSVSSSVTASARPQEDPAREAGEGNQGGAACFPAAAGVEMRDGRRKDMSEVDIGDMVRTGIGYSEVLMFTHRLREGDYPFVQLVTWGNRTLELSDEHFLEVEGRGYIAAREVRVGNVVGTVDGKEIVVEIGIVRREGLYNPQTMDGGLVVEGVVVSTFTEQVGVGAGMGLLVPIRAFVKKGWMEGLFDGGVRLKWRETVGIVGRATWSLNIL